MIRVDFSNDSRQYDKWIKLIIQQHRTYFYGEEKDYSGHVDVTDAQLNEWYDHFEKEWFCTIENTRTKVLDTVLFTDENYLLAILKYGPPA